MTEIDRSPARLLPTSNNRAATPQWGKLLLEEALSLESCFREGFNNGNSIKFRKSQKTDSFESQMPQKQTKC